MNYRCDASFQCAKITMNYLFWIRINKIQWGWSSCISCSWSTYYI